MHGIFFVLPEIIISVMACLILICDLFIKTRKYIIYYLSQITLIITIASLFHLINHNKCYLFNGAFVSDPFAVILKITTLLMALIIFIYSKKYMSYLNLFKGEYFVLCLLSILGMMVMISSGSFLSLYLGLELLSLPIYSLIIMNKNPISAEASMKYFIMGSIASGLFLFGVSISYGMTSVLEFKRIAFAIKEMEVYSDITLQYGIVFIISGLVFKFGAAPFHMWVPDVYEGSPIPVTLFIGTIPKIAALGMSYRLIIDAYFSLPLELEFLVMVVGAVSLFIGNIFALSQTNIKRLLGYSAIAHVGFIFLGLLVSRDEHLKIVIFYVFIYVFSSMGAFGVVMALSSQIGEANLLKNFNGLGISKPILGITMLLFLFSLAGVPPTAGFYAKFFVLKNLIYYGYMELALFSVVMSVIGAFYYLKIIKNMFFEKPDSSFNVVGVSNIALFILFLNGMLILLIGLYPDIILKIIKC